MGDWFQVDLGKLCAIDGLVLLPRDGNTHDFCRVFHIVGSPTGEFRGEETELCRETNRLHALVVPYTFPKGNYRYLRLVNDQVVDWVHLEEIEVFLWPNLREEYFYGGIGIRNAAKDPVDARGNSWIPESAAADKQAQRAKPDAGEILTDRSPPPSQPAASVGRASSTAALPPLPEIKPPDLPASKTAWRLPSDMPQDRDKIVLDDWGPVVPKGWVE